MEKLKKLEKILKGMGSVLLAYSGGLDSTFLLKVACDCLGKGVLAVSADSATYPPQELIFSRRMSKLLGARHQVVKTEEFKEESFVFNPPDRCYYCKKELFGRLRKIAREKKINFVIDAANLSDESDFRPGERAKKELGIRSPLKEAGFKKEDIRRISRKLGLPTWNKPSLACLASRIPYGTKISSLALERINQAEEYLRSLGFSQVRVRYYDTSCRIEVEKPDIRRLVFRSEQVAAKLKKLGYNYISVDLEGYRTGSLNYGVKK